MPGADSVPWEVLHASLLRNCDCQCVCHAFELGLLKTEVQRIGLVEGVDVGLGTFPVSVITFLKCTMPSDTNDASYARGWAFSRDGQFPGAPTWVSTLEFCAFLGVLFGRLRLDPPSSPLNQDTPRV